MAKNKDIKSAAATNMVWRFAERVGAQGVAFIVSIVLARILDPSDYGVIALVTVFTSILQVFVDGGLGNALIQKKDADDLDFSTVFYTNVVFCAVLYVIAFFGAPFVADFYNDAQLTPVIRVLSLTLLISGVKNIQQAYVSRKLLFRKFFFATLGGTIGAAVIGIYMAHAGYGVWALVAQQLFNTLVDTIILWITVKWRPKKIFSFERLKQLFSYGWKLLVANVIGTIYNDIRQLIIGKVYSSADLAYYNRGEQIPHLIVTNINSSIDSVLFPVLSDSQDNIDRVKNMTRRSIKTSSYIMWPMMFGIAAMGESLIKILLTDKWLPALPFLYIFCFVYGMMPIHTANINGIKAVGRSDIYLKTEIIKKCVGLLLIFISMKISVLAMGLSSVVYTLFASVVNAFPNRKLLRYPYLDQIKDVMPSFLLSAFMAAVIFVLPIKEMNIYLRLIIEIITGVVIYVVGSILFKMDTFYYLKDIVEKRFSGKYHK